VSTVLSIVGYAAIPVLAGTGGGAVAVIRKPGDRLRSGIQHFAAGVVFAVAAVELLPDIMKRHLVWEVAIGFAAGVVTMLGIKQFAERVEQRSQAGKSMVAWLVPVAIDIFLDGLLLGIGFSAGAKAGFLLTLALATELLSLGLATGISMLDAGRSACRSVLTIFAVSLVFLVGAGLGAMLLRTVSAEVSELILAFGLAALLYLVTEELLVEAHQGPEPLLATAAFFGGFLLFLIIGMKV
jgi:ZIP family zinc transporter